MSIDSRMDRIDVTFSHLKQAGAGPNVNTGLYAYFTEVEAEAELCRAKIKEWKDTGFTIDKDRIYLNEDPMSSQFFECVQSIIVDSGISHSVPYQDAQSFGVAPMMAMMGSADWKNDVSNSFVSVEKLHVFFLSLKRPTSKELGANPNKMEFSTMYYGHASTKVFRGCYGGAEDGRQQIFRYFECMAMVCSQKAYDKAGVSFIYHRSIATRSAGAVDETLSFI